MQSKSTFLTRDALSGCQAEGSETKTDKPNVKTMRALTFVSKSSPDKCTNLLRKLTKQPSWAEKKVGKQVGPNRLETNHKIKQCIGQQITKSKNQKNHKIKNTPKTENALCDGHVQSDHQCAALAAHVSARAQDYSTSGLTEAWALG